MHSITIGFKRAPDSRGHPGMQCVTETHAFKGRSVESLGIALSSGPKSSRDLDSLLPQ